jgi:hypothetical protein
MASDSKDFVRKFILTFVLGVGQNSVLGNPFHFPAVR